MNLTADGWHERQLPPGHVFDMAVSSSGQVWVLTDTAAWGLTGGSWTQIPLPERLSLARVILPFDSNDVWVTGEAGSPPTSHVWRWQGDAWSEVALPAVASDASTTAMAGTGPDDVWAMAWNGAVLRPMHWDGSTWTVHPPLPVRASETMKVIANARDDVWLLAGPQLLHWDGATWTPTRDPSLSDTNRYLDVSSGSSGTWLVDGAAGPHGELLHWDGTRWVPGPVAPADEYLSPRGSGEMLRLVVVGDEVVVVHGPYRWIDRNPDGSGVMGAGPVTAFTYRCGSV